MGDVLEYPSAQTEPTRVGAEGCVVSAFENWIVKYMQRIARIEFRAGPAERTQFLSHLARKGRDGRTFIMESLILAQD